MGRGWKAGRKVSRWILGAGLRLRAGGFRLKSKMTDLEQILPLWHALRASGTEYVLATVVAVEGSGYRKPGAQMLIGADGRRAGTISGGCLEGEVARKAFWHTEQGPLVRRYSTRAEDGEVPYGMGCGGVVQLLLERSRTAERFLEHLEAGFEARTPLAVATVLEGGALGERAYFPAGQAGGAGETTLARLAEAGFGQQRGFHEPLRLESGATAAVRVEWYAARPGLHIFGAGDDVLPVARMARQLGWYVRVADGRSNLATAARFPMADAVWTLPSGKISVSGLCPTDAAVLMTHSLDQDQRVLQALLCREIGCQIGYVGVLGPARRTREMVEAIVADGGLTGPAAAAQTDAWMQGLHAPMGLELGGETPASIALEVMAEIQRALRGGSGRALREVRGDGQADSAAGQGVFAPQG